MKKILHIAAFEGNIGDNASHMGFYSILDDVLDNYSIEKLEIRKSYNNYIAEDKLRFDDEFVLLANSFDLVVFGGGGFLDYWVDNSSNGTTIDIELDVLDRIKSKVLITSIGSNPHRKVPKENYKKFKRFLDYVKSSDNVKIALRNDGSVNSIKKDFGASYLEGMEEILDHGYFYSPSTKETLAVDSDYIAINITDDQLDMSGGIDSDRDWYYKDLEFLIESLSKFAYKVMLIPHIHQDVEAIGKLLERLPKNLVRQHIIVAPCLQSDYGTDFSFNLYKNAKYVIASRYHANVCSIKFDKPTIGLSPLPRIEYTHYQFTAVENNIEIKEGFSKEIVSLIKDSHVIKVDKNKLDYWKNKTMMFYKGYLNG